MEQVRCLLCSSELRQNHPTVLVPVFNLRVHLRCYDRELQLRGEPFRLTETWSRLLRWASRVHREKQPV
jgi:hypothetical protein